MGRLCTNTLEKFNESTEPCGTSFHGGLRAVVGSVGTMSTCKEVVQPFLAMKFDVCSVNLLYEYCPRYCVEGMT